MKPALFVARGIDVDRDGRRIVDGATIELEAAQVVTVAGPSGSGKSTLLRALATLIPIASGSLALEGSSARAIGITEFRRRVAYVPQSPRLLDGTVADNVGAGPRFRGVTTTPEEVRALLARVGLREELAARAARDLSGGERLRVALARALANAPRVLLLDEPTASLDPEASRTVLAALAALAAQGAALVAVTHVAEHAARLGGQAYRMDAGVLSRGPHAS